MKEKDYSCYKKYVNTFVEFPDGIFSFHTAIYGSWQNDARKVFRVREDNTEHERAKQKGIRYYDRIVTANAFEIVRWIETHPHHQPLE